MYLKSDLTTVPFITTLLHVTYYFYYLCFSYFIQSANIIVCVTCHYNRYRYLHDVVVMVTDNYAHIYAKYLSAYHMQFEVYRQHNGAKISDVMMALQLKEENIINGKLNIRPGLTTEIRVSNLDLNLQP